LKIGEHWTESISLFLTKDKYFTYVVSLFFYNALPTMIFIQRWI